MISLLEHTARASCFPKFTGRSYKSLSDTAINTAEALDETETIIDCDVDPTSAIAVGDLLRIENEWVGRVTARSAAPANITVATRGYNQPAGVTHDTAKDIYKVSVAKTVLWLPGHDDPQSGTIRDRSGNGNHGTITGATWVRTVKGLWVLSFNGDDYVDCGLAASLLLQNLSIKYWVLQPATIAYQGIVATADASGLNGYRSGISDSGLVEVLIGNATIYEQMLGTTVMDDNKWHLVIVTIDPSWLRVYVDGVQEGTPVARTITTTFSNTLKIGAWSNLNSYFTGQVGLVEIGPVLTASEISDVYRRERHLFNV